MKIGVAGLGSMGKRRVRDLQRLGCEIIGFDASKSRCQEATDIFGIATCTSFDELVQKGIQALVISVPTDQHAGYYEKCYVNKLPFFSEASIFTPRHTWFEDMEQKTGVRSFPSATWKCHPMFQLTKELIHAAGINTVNSVHYHYGGYLPLWHPYEDYADYYAGQKKTSAAREMVPFEMEWLCYVFGPVEAVSAVKGQMGAWRTDMDDTYFLHLQFKSGIYGTLNIELHQTAPFRFGKISCRDYSLELDLINHKIKRYDLAADSWKFIGMPGVKVMNSFNFEDVYFKEMECFYSALREQKAYPKSWTEDRHLSDILYAAEESWRARRWVSISDIADQYDGMNW